MHSGPESRARLLSLATEFFNRVDNIWSNVRLAICKVDLGELVNPKLAAMAGEMGIYELGLVEGGPRQK